MKIYLFFFVSKQNKYTYNINIHICKRKGNKLF